MTQDLVYRQLAQLPEQLQLEVLHYVEFLVSRVHISEISAPKIKRKRPFGLAKGKIRMAPNFDEPLEDFKEYMA